MLSWGCGEPAGLTHGKAKKERERERMKKEQNAGKWVDVKSADELKPGDRIRYSDNPEDPTIWIGDEACRLRCCEGPRIIGADGNEILGTSWTLRELFSEKGWKAVQVWREAGTKDHKRGKRRFRAARCADGKGESPCNGKRAKWAEAALHGFLAATGEADHIGTRGYAGEDETADLLTDLLHLCDKKGLDAEKLLGRAKRNWEHER